MIQGNVLYYISREITTSYHFFKLHTFERFEILFICRNCLQRNLVNIMELLCCHHFAEKVPTLLTVFLNSYSSTWENYLVDCESCVFHTAVDSFRWCIIIFTSCSNAGSGVFRCKLIDSRRIAWINSSHSLWLLRLQKKRNYQYLSSFKRIIVQFDSGLQLLTWRLLGRFRNTRFFYIFSMTDSFWNKRNMHK